MSESLLSQLSDHYCLALRKHLERGKASLLSAHALGTEAVNLGLETLDLAKMHHQALETEILSESAPALRDEMSARAEMFFTEALVPIEKTHRFARETGAELEEIQERLGQSALDLEDSNRDLQQCISERMSAEAALENSLHVSQQLLQESRLVEKELKDMTRKIMAVDEVERRKMSLQLHDDIGQALLGIYVRLLALKTQATSGHAGLSKEIATTQNLVEAAVKTINLFAHEYGIPRRA
jgi:signal transduction histidine kinase